MIDRTSTENAGWTLVEADNKYYARVKILRVLVDQHYPVGGLRQDVGIEQLRARDAERQGAGWALRLL